ncbi:uncharacterized protein G2W53_007208 [Senna tora]|uniref:Uncharacterized protein n=1 Tax=Senna tora TaxID=362788 RepID=A0A835CEQ9_9FABA|nr:uncharacterized protein G2W53_007208 [Senna tora]
MKGYELCVICWESCFEVLTLTLWVRSRSLATSCNINPNLKSGYNGKSRAETTGEDERELKFEDALNSNVFINGELKASINVNDRHWRVEWLDALKFLFWGANHGYHPLIRFNGLSEAMQTSE